MEHWLIEKNENNNKFKEEKTCQLEKKIRI